MKLKDCKYGKIVVSGNRIGMVVGITNTCPHRNSSERSKPENARPLIEWAGGTTHAIHQGNIELYKGSL